MDPNQLKNLGLDSSLNEKDLQLLSQILGSISGNTKGPKISARERNNLLSKLTANKTIDNVPKKELKDMNEEEKKIYRQELKQKLKNKQNEKKMLRTTNFAKKNNSKYTETVNKINEMMINTNLSESNNESNEGTNNEIATELEPKENLNENLNEKLHTDTDLNENIMNIKQEIMINKLNELDQNNEQKINENIDDFLN